MPVKEKSATVQPATNGGKVPVVKLTKDRQKTPPPRRWLLPAVLAVVAVLLGSAAAWFGVAAAELRSSPAAANSALTDATATAEVKRQVTSAINAVFSYDHANIGKTEQAAKRLLTGSARAEYEQLIGTVKQQAPQQKLVLTTTVVSAGVVMLQGDRARLLVFADQRNVRSDTGEASYAGAQFAVDAVRAGDSWKISHLTIFSG
ncbi:nuclear transport factor 2 family protein [Fodinicola acaciae]|uniref:nuclear transport factor 2 family protein n=1 Tax=Fodinicola acaciae TaxID=2681555 RepID=UPI0013D076DA|nr:nuclear transport factor 2 family protein [Fodinicola acaciae]